jgi:hypothetical protein
LAAISFNLPENAPVKIKLTDMSGRLIDEVANRTIATGTNEVNYSKQGLKPGSYILTLETGTSTDKIKLVVK